MTVIAIVSALRMPCLFRQFLTNGRLCTVVSAQKASTLSDNDGDNSRHRVP